ncbi:hypothetical protein [Saccharicrinis fermentans]|uniref:Uncharacterized protein n=1 Tax=Saccharicrinis fermentans DSM 9555 = JCM 21142 TaxID=869213 RepID=W7YIX1_9BACT|nr:hypothetical protein [Saccharicrinis fermentans]GAF02474.1 hypothetical protein JCM21142_31109 [Saccharicrinis fermentans DSM 9555 = JCM 21142]
MKKTFLLFGLAVATLFTACSEDDEKIVEKIIEDNGIIVKVSSNITENTTWDADSVYQLGGRITVLDDVTLTIEPGTIIKGEAGTGSNATALLVARGATLLAEGTPSAPIIFTSVADELLPEDIAAGNFASPNLDNDINGLWGGVIVLGKAPISAANESDEDVTEIQIEGIPTSDTNGLYGGNDEEDNSGILKYISIRHGGANIGSGNEINGLSLGGVGNKTTIENIEIVANQDDGIEWFGGSVDVKNVVVWNVGDDGLDTDQAWSGSVDNFIVITPAGHAFELDGPEGSDESVFASHSISNGTVIASEFDSEGEVERECEDLINGDANSMVSLSYINFTAINTQTIDADILEAADVSISNIVLDVAEEDLLLHLEDATEVPATVTAGTTSTVDKSVFSWTWAYIAGKF